MNLYFDRAQIKQSNQINSAHNIIADNPAAQKQACKVDCTSK